MGINSKLNIKEFKTKLRLLAQGLAVELSENGLEDFGVNYSAETKAEMGRQPNAVPFKDPPQRPGILAIGEGEDGKLIMMMRADQQKNSDIFVKAYSEYVRQMLIGIGNVNEDALMADMLDEAPKAYHVMEFMNRNHGALDSHAFSLLEAQLKPEACFPRDRTCREGCTAMLHIFRHYEEAGQAKSTNDQIAYLKRNTVNHVDIQRHIVRYEEDHVHPIPRTFAALVEAVNKHCGDSIVNPTRIQESASGNAATAGGSSQDGASQGGRRGGGGYDAGRGRGRGDGGRGRGGGGRGEGGRGRGRGAGQKQFQYCFFHGLLGHTGIECDKMMGAAAEAEGYTQEMREATCPDAINGWPGCAKNWRY